VFICVGSRNDQQGRPSPYLGCSATIKKSQTRDKTDRVVYKGLCLLILSDILILK
jgi:hypothetical protein